MKKDILIKTGTGALNAVYSAMKLLPQKKRVVILSRQSNEPSLDICLLRDELVSRGIGVKVLCDKMGPGIKGAVRYMGPLFRQMRYLATSRVAVLDSYCIPACIFPKRRGLTVIQMWHALGAMKKFSKSILDKPEGKSSEIARLMKMHEGYDVIFTSSEKARPAFAEAFGYPPEALTIMSLPRVDVILNSELDRENRDRIYDRYPVLSRKKSILYAPTLRIGKDMSGAVLDLIRHTDTEKYNLVIKMHPLTEIDINDDLAENVIIDKDFSTMEMMAVADFVVTDYSAITYDAALKALPVYFYAFDKEEYLKDREFYLDYDRDMPGPICADAAEVMKEIDSGRTDEYRRRSEEFADLYIEKRTNCTAEIADLVQSYLR
ncbi:MAG: hypothetical protein E7220_00035 [Clostridiales bacterium]|nr:hypothetical protein [Clostridiales bacterium]